MSFDPYRKWLGIPANNRSPNFYDLLAITAGENDIEVIRNAIEQRRSFVQSKRGEGHDDAVRILLGQFDEAASTLLVPEFKVGYDHQLGLHLKGKRLSNRRSYILPNWMESRVVRVYGEGSGIVGDLFGIVAIIFSAFALIACLSFWLQAKTTKNGTVSEPTWIENLVRNLSGTNGDTESPESVASVANPVQAQVAELRSKLTKWQESQEKLRRLVNTLEKDRKSILGKLDDLANNKIGGENSPEGKVLAAELSDIVRQTEACKTKQSAYDLAILKSESKLRSIERQLAASEAGVSEAELTELAATVMALDESLSDQDTVNSIADALDGSTSKMLNEFRDNRKQTEQSGWLERIASMPASRQAEEVSKRLIELNPGFDGKVETKIVGGAIVELSMVTDRVSDISPLAALKALTSLSLRGSTVDWNTRSGSGKVSDIRPLKGMRLTNLDLVFNPIENISVIEGMPLAVLDIAFSPNISDISVVRGMPLVRFQCQETNVSDLSPLAGAKLNHINIVETPISSLEPLRGMPLHFVNCGVSAITSIEPLRGAPVNALIIYSTKVSDLGPVEMMPLKNLNIHNTSVSDLSPIYGKPIEELIFSPDSFKSDLTSIRNMKSIKRISDVTWKTESPDVFWRRIDQGKNSTEQSKSGPTPNGQNQPANANNTEEETIAPFKQKSVWSGEGIKLTVIERKGGTFRAKLETKEWSRIVKGTVNEGKVTWLAKDVQPIKGGIGGDNFGTISKDEEGYRMDVEWKQSNGVSGTGTYRLND
jgi:hypothetical protein